MPKHSNSPYAANSILRKLDEESIVAFEIDRENNLLVVTEQCDDYYDVDLTYTEAKQLIKELTELVEQIKE